MKWTPSQKPQKMCRTLWAISLMLLVLSLSACAKRSTVIKPEIVQQQVRAPMLPANLNLPERPTECLPSCLEKLTNDRQRWRSLLTDLTSQPKAANEAIKP